MVTMSLQTKNNRITGETRNGKPRQRKYYRNRSADDRQAEVHTHFPADSFLGSPSNADHVMQWTTFFRRNIHRFATDYLGIKLHLYQVLMMYMMGVSRFIVVIASRASAKSFIIALYACCRCILYPNSLVVLSSATKGQSKLIVSEKIQKELMNLSPVLRQEIKKIKDNQNEVIIWFRNNSTITVVPASDNGRGYRSNVLIREEFRQIKKFVDDSILSPFQIIRQTPYIQDPYYADMDDVHEENIDIYISSSWFDNGQNWMWNIVDQAYDDMMRGGGSVLLAFDESIALKHKIKTIRYFKTERKKQDPITWKLEFLNYRLKENTASYFSYSMMEQNQRLKRAFYPRLNSDFRLGKKNTHDIPKQPNEVRIVSCDMAFVTNKTNDNSIFSCLRLLPESTTYNRGGNEDLKIDNGYRRQVVYLESIQGGDVTKQALRIRQLFEDFGADYIVLDTRNGGIAVYDLLANIMYDEQRCVEYSPLTCMNDDGLRDRIRIEGAVPCIFAVNATQKLNSDIALDFRRVLETKKIEFLIPFEQARDEILSTMKDYVEAAELETQVFFESPFLETQALVNETIDLIYEKKVQTGAIVISEQGNNRKDRYTSVSYGSYFASLLEKDVISQNEEYEFSVLVN